MSSMFNAPIDPEARAAMFARRKQRLAAKAAAAAAVPPPQANQPVPVPMEGAEVAVPYTAETMPQEIPAQAPNVQVAVAPPTQAPGAAPPGPPQMRNVVAGRRIRGPIRGAQAPPAVGGVAQPALVVPGAATPQIEEYNARFAARGGAPQPLPNKPLPPAAAEVAGTNDALAARRAAIRAQLSNFRQQQGFPDVRDARYVR